MFFGIVKLESGKCCYNPQAFKFWFTYIKQSRAVVLGGADDHMPATLWILSCGLSLWVVTAIHTVTKTTTTGEAKIFIV